MGAQSRNLALVVSTHNMVEPAAAVSPFVAAPEGAPVRARSGMGVVDVSLDRIPLKKDC